MFDAYSLPFTAKNTAYHDLTGRFPHRSSRGMEYLIVVHNHDSNSILMIAIKNKTGAEIKCGWTSIHERLARGGNQPELYILDNEASADLKKGLKKYKLEYQLVPPHIHRRNAAERAMIRTFKNHFLACLATCDPDLGPTLAPSRAHFESSSLFARESEIVCVCILEQKLRFQQNTTCSSMDQSRYPSQA
jgi:hypothetical protein